MNFIDMKNAQNGFDIPEQSYTLVVGLFNFIAY